jgi:hypothetical protein
MLAPLPGGFLGFFGLLLFPEANGILGGWVHGGIIGYQLSNGDRLTPIFLSRLLLG